MKLKFSLLLGLFLISSVSGQINELPLLEFMAIEINGVSFENLENTKGNISDLETYFGKAKTIEEREGGAEENWRRIEFNEIILSFYNVDLEDYKPFIGYFKAKNISVNGKRIAIGESITGLGTEIIFNTKVDKSKSIIFQAGDCCSIIIEFDQNTNLTTKIEYFVWT